MLNEEICKLREQLNESIINGQDYTITYKLSVELDELIAKYYRRENHENTKVKVLI
ncbi:MAG: aspartyl-phosphate phosphatase Spo0E family protein [Clostridia bacterium]